MCITFLRIGKSENIRMGIAGRQFHRDDREMPVKTVIERSKQMQKKQWE